MNFRALTVWVLAAAREGQEPVLELYLDQSEAEERRDTFMLEGGWAVQLEPFGPTR